jgi:acetyl/propionyl-CoA carboxylase alpha subunit
LLIANRGEIASRIIRTARELGIETVAVHAVPDSDAAHVHEADIAVALDGDTPATSYLDAGAILKAAEATGADAVHPGYGFLAENAAFARSVEEARLTFVGPTPESIEAMGDKIRAREVAERTSLPLVPSATLDGTAKDRAKAAKKLGYPVLVKAAAGGGGRGMRVVASKDELETAVEGAQREAGSAFGDDRVFLEKYITGPRHIEVQIFGDGNGRVVHLGERECSVQRRHQKIIEESPSPFVDDDLRARMTDASARLAAEMNYRGAGTVEFVVGEDRSFYFLEMNTRLQVEHPVTEAVTGTDLVRWQIEVARTGALPAIADDEQNLAPRGHAIECRIYAEDPENGFLPTAGNTLRVELPAGPGIRVDSALCDGFEVPVAFDPMLAKLIAWAPDREQAVTRMLGAIDRFAILGITTNTAFLRDVVAGEDFARGAFTTTTVETKYGDWSASNASKENLACALAALVTTSGRGNAAPAAGGTGRAPSPWDTLGAWRLAEEPGGGKR